VALVQAGHQSPGGRPTGQASKTTGKSSLT